MTLIAFVIFLFAMFAICYFLIQGGFEKMDCPYYDEEYCEQHDCSECDYHHDDEDNK